MTTGTETGPSARRGDIPGVVVALVVAVALSIALITVTRTGVVSGALQQLIADVCVWVPLLAAVWWTVRGMSRPLIADRLGLRVGPFFGATDLLFGFAAGCIARAFDAFINLGLYGTTGLTPAPVLLGAGSLVPLAVLAIVGPCVVSPIVEELFFRGSLQRALAARYADGFWGRAAAVFLTSLVFAFAHLFIGGQAGTVTVFSTFVLGMLTGALAASTGRIGGAIVAHVTFNVIAVWLTWSY